MLTSLATYYVVKATEARDQLRFENTVQRTQNDIENRLDTYIAMLRAGSGLFAANEEVSQAEFRAYASRLRLREYYPGIQGIGFSRRVTAENLADFRAEMQQQGINLVIQPDFERSEYHIILYLDPLDLRNQAAIGYDMFTEPVRRAAMMQARDGAAPAASGRVTLVQEIDDRNKQAGFLIYVPIYEGGVIPETITERRSALLGFVYSPFRAADLLTGIFGTRLQYVDFEVYDGAVQPENLLYRSQDVGDRSDFTAAIQQPQLTAVRSLQVAGRTWTLTFVSRPEFTSLSSRSFIPYTFLAGIVTSLVLFGVTRSQAHARTAAELSTAHLQASEQALRQSEERLRFALKAANMVAWEWNLQQDQVIRSPNFRQVFGLPPDATLGKPDSFLDLIHPDDRPFVVEAQQDAIAHQTEYSSEFRLLSPEGKVRWMADRGQVRGDRTGDIRIGGVVQDITHRKNAEAALSQSEERFRRLFDSNLIGIAFWNVEGLITDANDAFLQLIGVTRASLQTQGSPSWRDFTPSEYQARDDQAVEEAMLTGASSIYEKEYLHPNGQRVSVVLGITLLNDLGHDAHYDGVTFALDITERKRVEAERLQLLDREQAARAEAEKANRLKDEFLATLSHELRTPLNAMVGWTQLLQTRKFDEATTARAMETIARNTKSLTQLIEDLLDVSRIMTGKFRLNLQSVKLSSVVAAATEAVQSAAAAKEIQLVASYDPDLEPIVCDPTRLQQVVWNLLNNAIKFTPPNGQVEVQLQSLVAPSETTQQKTGVQMLVKDSGQGIAPDFLPYIFERFRQADGTITRSQGGLGIGLAIVRHIVELHGGEIRAESPGLGKGATFAVTLPLCPPASEHDISEPGTSEPDTLGPDAEPPSSDASTASVLPILTATMTPTANSAIAPHSHSQLEGLHILVVEDEADTRALLTILLEEQGGMVTAVDSAAAAIATLTHPTKAKPDVLISDIGMPKEDGYHLIRNVRSLHPTQGGQIPAIALTAYARASERDRAIAAGFHVHVAKPVVPEALVAIVADLAHRKGQ